MTPRTPALAIALAAVAIATAHGQTCTDPHDRWTVKTTLAQQGAAVTAATPSAMLKNTATAMPPMGRCGKFTRCTSHAPIKAKARQVIIHPPRLAA